MDEKKKKLAFAIAEFLGTTRDQLIDEEKKESVNGPSPPFGPSSPPF